MIWAFGTLFLVKIIPEKVIGEVKNTIKNRIPKNYWPMMIIIIKVYCVRESVHF